MASIYLKYTFPPAGESDVCMNQDVVAAGTNLIINGNYAVSNSTASFIDKGYCRNLSFRSPSDLSNVIIKITGIQNNAQVTENITGPNNNIVYSFKYYDVVTSINVSAPVVALKVGSGYQGFFKILPIDTNRSFTNYALSIASLASINQYNTAIWSTLENVAYDAKLNPYPYSYRDILNNNVGTLKVEKTYGPNGNLYSLPAASLVNQLLVEVSGDASSLSNNGLTLIFIQT